MRTPPCGHPRLVLIRLVEFLCAMVTCRLVTMFLIQPAVTESRVYLSIAPRYIVKSPLYGGLKDCVVLILVKSFVIVVKASFAEAASLIAISLSRN